MNSICPSDQAIAPLLANLPNFSTSILVRCTCSLNCYQMMNFRFLCFGMTLSCLEVALKASSVPRVKSCHLSGTHLIISLFCTYSSGLNASGALFHW